MGNSTNALRGSNNNGDGNKGRMGNADKPGEHVENIITRENVNYNKEDIEEIINEDTERDLVKNNHLNEPSDQVTTVNPQKMIKKTNKKEKTKRVIRRERTGKGDVLKKYCWGGC